MKVLVDMNMSPRWAVVISAAGHHAVHWTEVGHEEDADPVIMRFALEGGCVLLTHDLDFGIMLASSGAGRPSLIQVRAMNASPEFVEIQVLLALERMAEQLAVGCIITVDSRKTRLRLLPFERRG